MRIVTIPLTSGGGCSESCLLADEVTLSQPSPEKGRSNITSTLMTKGTVSFTFSNVCWGIEPHSVLLGKRSGLVGLGAHQVAIIISGGCGSMRR